MTLAMWRDMARCFERLSADSGAKAILNALVKGPGALDLAQAERIIAQAADSDDDREGRDAFAARRAPAFKGR